MISLRDVIAEDANLLYIWKEDHTYKKMASHPKRINTIEKQQQDIECTIADPDQDYKLILLDNEPIGFIRVGWYTDEYGGRLGWISYALGTHKGHGYCSKALRLYFDQLKHPVRINAIVYTINLISQRLLERLGFTRIITDMTTEISYTYSLDLPKSDSRKLVAETNYDALRSDTPKSFDPTAESNSFLINPQKYLEFK